ncbi:lron-12 [Pristionchus pacificus]|uniref:Lron-12 n=1 Tax=Pristionchus pacificus TaxID=54126 RepID=A0A2A6CTD4_PRIPA|nr:lron-12 [Pristionchus pacificus]|eukprot:PDM81445.1 lron-12 [Pristionchus pacificus]
MRSLSWLVGWLSLLTAVSGLGGGGHFLEPADHNDCPERCRCDRETRTAICTSIIGGLPPRLPPEFDSLTIQNATDFYVIPKHSFRKMDRLREIRFENCPHLQTIEKFAFKNLRNLRLLSFSGCPSLTELVKGAFSSIQNEELLKIRITAPIRTVHGGAFRHACRLREVSISGSLMHLQKHAFSSINQLDFLDLSGVMKIDSHAFSNSTRFHIINIFMSQVSIEKYAFADLNGIHQIIIHRCRLPVLESEAFSGVITLEHLELCDNDIGMMSPHAFTGAINVGRIKLARNKIDRMESPDAVNQGDAITLALEGNKIRCSCDLKWMSYHSNRDLVNLNYCADERTVRNYLSNFCFAAPGSIIKSANRVTSSKSCSTALISTSFFSIILFAFVF